MEAACDEESAIVADVSVRQRPLHGGRQRNQAA
jgi:hypothetical protein